MNDKLFPINEDWEKAEKKIDPNFEGSMWQTLGMDKELCPTCNAHLHNGICLNACHLTPASKMAFHMELLEHINIEKNIQKAFAEAGNPLKEGRLPEVADTEDGFPK
jgi:hypothetical protein